MSVRVGGGRVRAGTTTGLLAALRTPLGALASITLTVIALGLMFGLEHRLLHLKRVVVGVGRSKAF